MTETNIDIAEVSADRDSQWARVEYKCRKCGALDHDRILADGSPAPLINCWNCGSGRKQATHHEMQMAGTGMVLVSSSVPVLQR